MAYIGRGIENFSQIEVLDVITFTDSAGPYNILKDSVAFTPSTVNSLLIEVDGIIQAPASYTVDGSTITFGASMASTSTMNSMIHFGTGLITTPADGSVTAAKIASDAVTTAKILDNNVTVAKLPTTLDISGNTVTLPASVSGLGTGITNAQLAGSIDVTSKITGVVPTANLGSGSASASTYLAGDQTYKEVVAIDIAWQSVVTGATLTAVAGRGYPINTTSNACTVTLPASASVGDQIIFTDYARNFATNALTINPNSLKYQGNTTPQPVYDTAGESIHIVYMDVTKGWIPINDGAVALETPQNYTIEWLVIAGGGSGGSYQSGGGGAGGYRLKYASENSGGGTNTESLITLTGGTVYTMTIGAGGAAVSGDGDPSSWGKDGEDSVLSGSNITDITSIGGGGGGTYQASPYTMGDGRDGGSGGGEGHVDPATSATNGAGTANQGYDGGAHTGSYTSPYAGGGGGGASAVGGTSVSGGTGDGGAGLTSAITASSVARGGGGGGLGGSGNDGGGNGGSGSGDGTDGTANTGGGSGGGSNNASASGAGGSGVIILRMLDADYSGTTTGSPTVATGQGGSANETILTYNATGTYTA